MTHAPVITNSLVDRGLEGFAKVEKDRCTALCEISAIRVIHPGPHASIRCFCGAPRPIPQGLRSHRGCSSLRSIAGRDTLYLRTPFVVKGMLVRLDLRPHLPVKSTVLDHYAQHHSPRYDKKVSKMRLLFSHLWWWCTQRMHAPQILQGQPTNNLCVVFQK